MSSGLDVPFSTKHGFFNFNHTFFHGRHVKVRPFSDLVGKITIASTLKVRLMKQ